MITATYDAAGNLTGFYSDAIAYASIPTLNVQIDEATHLDAIANPGKYTVVNGKVVAANPWPTAAMEAAAQKAAANAPIFRQIAALEATQTPRLYREAALGSTVVNPVTGRTAAQQLAYVDEQVAALRKNLK
jgi:hypothetical protein